jgi:hypothetical protein
MLAELEIYHSRPIAPTRRVAIGRTELPVDPAPGAGSLLLGAVVARHIQAVDHDLLADLTRLTHQIERGYRIAQPRLRHRFQEDRVGLTRSRHRAVADGGSLSFVHDDHSGLPVQQVLGAVYAVAGFDLETRRMVMAIVRRGIRWVGDADEPDEIARLVAHLQGNGDGFALPVGSNGDPVSWALRVLEFTSNGETSDRPEADDVTRRFRTLIRDAHPDVGGASVAAASRIQDLTEARRILLS